MEDWQKEFKIKSPLTLADVRKFERAFRDVLLLLMARNENPVLITDHWGEATSYLCAAIDTGLIETPAASIEGDVYTIDGIDILNAEINDKSKRIFWYGGEVAALMKEATTVPFLSSRKS